jgi:predicted DNA-binding transcriptional regulator YafY
MSPAAEQLLRLVHLIPLAARPGGLRVAEAAAMHGVDEGQIEKDFRRLSDRSWYLPPGRTDDFQIFFMGERIVIEAPPAFTRPPRLTLDELFACAVALRSAGLDDAERAALCGEIEAALVGALGEAGGAQTSTSPDVSDPPVEVALHPAGADELAGAVSRGIVLRRRLRFGYVKPDAEAPEVRAVEPWFVVHAEGDAYLVAHDTARGAPRIFRHDRMLGVQVLDEACTEAVALEPADVVHQGVVRLVADEPPHARGADGRSASGSAGGGEGAGPADGRELRWARVRYSPGVARWVRERWDGDDGADGSYTVRHRLLTEEWLVRHVLAHGAEAEVVEPAELRARVVEAVGEG